MHGRGQGSGPGHGRRDQERRARDRGLSGHGPEEQDARPAGGGGARMTGSYLIGDEMTGGYGGADILHGVTIAVDKGEIAVIVGPNGAGKSTAMKAMFGMLPLRAGQVRLGGRDITALTPQERVREGMAFVPQTNNVFASMTVEENLEMGAFIRDDDFSATMEQVFELFPVLREKRRQPAGELSGGQRQQVAVGRALMTRPSVLMLDEPTAGVSPIVMDELFDRIIEIARAGIAVLMVEQNARQALNIADRGYVLVQGRNRYTGTGAELLADPEVRRSFLGG
nr:ABC transporter ATP-binding protein [Oceanicella actignis]